MNILVTGGAGYIGSHVCIELIEAGHNVIIIDNLSNSNREVINRMQMITGKTITSLVADIRHAEVLDVIFRSFLIDSVIHLAGCKSVNESIEDPIKYYTNNLSGTIQLVETMDKYNVHQLVFSSSATVYGVPEHCPIPETAPLNTVNPYGRTKLAVEYFLNEFIQSKPYFSIALLRYFNPIGAHESGLIGEDPQAVPNNLMPYITQVATGLRSHLNVFGDDFATIDGTGVRDYIHVVDLAKGHAMALDSMVEKKGLNVYNLGTGNGYSVLQLVSTFEKVTGKSIPFKIVNRREGDVAICYADPSKANSYLQWEAERSLEDMCRDAWRWQKNNPYGYRTIENESMVSELY
ncbi:UDP-glucose 4-epimerase GalE [Viridibacillus arvi]|uniref:UDP-glucose 4-epimerase GalE n=1 Tax=Viridibacillus arvi TaxID=263475 RepID=UPI003D03EBDA